MRHVLWRVVLVVALSRPSPSAVCCGLPQVAFATVIPSNLLSYSAGYALNVHIPSGEGICTCVVQYISMVLYNNFLGQIVFIGLLNSGVSVSTCITCPYTHIRYIAQMPVMGWGLRELVEEAVESGS